jgi:hypothetical protein
MLRSNRDKGVAAPLSSVLRLTSLLRRGGAFFLKFPPGLPYDTFHAAWIAMQVSNCSKLRFRKADNNRQVMLSPNVA